MKVLSFNPDPDEVYDSVDPIMVKLNELHEKGEIDNIFAVIKTDGEDSHVLNHWFSWGNMYELLFIAEKLRDYIMEVISFTNIDNGAEE